MIVERSTRFFGVNFRPQLIEGTNKTPYREEFYRHSRTTRKLLGIIGASTHHYSLVVHDTHAVLTKSKFNARTGEVLDKKRCDVTKNADGEARTFAVCPNGWIRPKPCFQSVSTQSPTAPILRADEVTRYP